MTLGAPWLTFCAAPPPSYPPPLTPPLRPPKNLPWCRRWNERSIPSLRLAPAWLATRRCWRRRLVPGPGAAALLPCTGTDSAPGSAPGREASVPWSAMPGAGERTTPTCSTTWGGAACQGTPRERCPSTAGWPATVSNLSTQSFPVGLSSSSNSSSFRSGH